ncbi:MAG: DUF1810 domain-containing protein [Enterobacterales bacterium]|nr:DUF1810 domain-containing protein [Enterobacterales bacterium]
MNDKYDLSRFRNAQDICYHRVKAELSMGYKQSHWIWFVFPQLEGLGQSITAREYALSSLDEAACYLSDDLLGNRLKECCELLLAAKTNHLPDIMGDLDSIKVRSCVTLFNSLTKAEPIFQLILDKYFSGKPDPLTLNLLGQQTTRH